MGNEVADFFLEAAVFYHADIIPAVTANSEAIPSKYSQHSFKFKLRLFVLPSVFFGFVFKHLNH
jgi:hypothetical protein